MGSYYYQTCFGGIAALCLALLSSQPTRKQQVEQLQQQQEQEQEQKQKQNGAKAAHEEEHPEANWYKAYALAVAADWLQGSHLVSLYRDEHGLEAGVVLSLYMTDFIATALSAYFIGFLADKYGRKLYCMVYCVSYALSCFLTVVPVTPLLFLGRVLGGVSTSILFSVFESWMVANFRKNKLEEKACDLSRTFAATAVVNSLVAILMGFLGEVLVWVTGTRKTPFLSENFGTSSSAESTPRQSLRSILKAPSILVLALASTIFDSAMNLFVFYWGPALNSLHASTSTAAGELPYGTINAGLMAASMVGALAFNIIINKRIITYPQLSAGALLVAGLCFAKLAAGKTEAGAFWLFCLLEICTGVFGPCVSYLKGGLISDDSRTTVYSIMRVPFNVLAFVSLLVVKDNNNVGAVFATCSLLLVASFTTTLAATWRGIL
ncbi:hypothetical protein NPX13_g6805 [Xylaria arbuscula]|uniref:Molybdate-anion transporter n=1 Tax=Xylaria arbuscula TaxID=114810 RepID=A0A9W8NC67_9PEZI|nr:hypothetical protein NPX13_g6805 [Xylaria arbuscula]